jgi:2-iminobutanoate/2-iminopropanoate deaminase
VPDQAPPPPIGFYRPIVRAGEWLVCSGQLGIKGGEFVAGGVAAETTQAIANLESLLVAEGLALTDIVKTTVFLADMTTFDEMNDAYAAAFGDYRPARSAIGVAALPRGAAVEIEAWAHTT